VRIHRRSHRYSRRRSLVRHRRSRAHGHRWRGLPRSLGVDDMRGRPLTRWWTIHGRSMCSDHAWRSRRLWSRAWRSRCHCGRAWPTGVDMAARGATGIVEAARGTNPGRTAGAGRGATSGSKPGRTTRAGWQATVVVELAVGSRVPMVETMEPDSKRKFRLIRLGEAASGKLSSSKNTCRETIKRFVERSRQR
jgi:hypothetical protein